MHEQNLADRERVLGADHPHTLARAATSASPTWPRAARLRRSPCTSRTWPTASGYWAPTTLTPCTARGNLANAYRDAGRTAEAITLHEQNLADRERVLGADHPYTLNSRNNLAIAYRAAGRTAEAGTEPSGLLTRK